MKRDISKTAILGVILLFYVANAGEIHPQLAKKLTALKEENPLQVIVHMKEQARLSVVSEKTPKVERILYLRNFAAARQADLLSYLDSHDDRIIHFQTYWIFNGLTFSAAKDIIEAVAAREDVDYVIDDFTITLDPEFRNDACRLDSGITWNINQVKAPLCWDDGYDGTGIIVGNIDTGVDVDHEAFGGRWVPGGWYDAVNDSAYPYDDHWHGTHCMGLLCGGDGNGPFNKDIGIAPGANFICAKVFDANGQGSASWVHNAFQWFATQNVHVCSNSWTWYRTSLEFWHDCQNLRSLGIYPIFALGNSGPNPMSDDAPGNYPIAIGAGATDQFDNIARFSSRGPAPVQSPWNDTMYWPRPDWNLTKPDICAPGVGCFTSIPGGMYTTGGGTSGACPHVAGAIAICLQRDSTLTFDEIYNILTDNADHPAQGEPYPNNNYGWGRLNVYAALYAIPGWNMPNVVLRQSSVVNDNNGNGILDPGEDAGIVCLIKNIGTQPATNIQTTLRTTSPLIAITDSMSTYGTLNAGDSADNALDPFDIQVEASASAGTLVDFELCIVSAETTWTRIFSKQIGIAPGDIIWGPADLQYLTTSNVEIHGVAYDPIGNQIFVLNRNNNYIHIYSSDSSVTHYGYFQGPDAQLTDIAYSDYDDNLWVTSINQKEIWKIEKSGNILRQFSNPANDVPTGLAYHNHILWCGDQRSTVDDTQYFYISDTLGNASQYMNAIQGDRNSCCIAYDTCGNSFVQIHTWFNDVTQLHDSTCVVEYQGEPPALTGNRFRLLEGWSARGIEFDPRDGNYWITIYNITTGIANQIIKVKGFYDATTGVAEMKLPKEVEGYKLDVYPNPVTEQLSCRLQLPTQESVSFRIYDIAGRLVCKLIDSRVFNASSHRVTWNLKDTNGNGVANGIYFLLFKTDSKIIVRKAIVTR